MPFRHVSEGLEHFLDSLGIETDRALQAKGYSRVEWNGDFTVDYIYAPGLRSGMPGEGASNLSPSAGVRPNTTMSQAERDNAIAVVVIEGSDGS